MESKNEFRELPEVKTEVIDPEFEPVAVKIEIQDDSYDRETSKLYYEAQDQNNTAVEHCKNRTPSPPATIENSQSKETLNGLYANEENSQPTEIAACPDGSEENCQESDRIEKRNLDENIKCERKVLIRRKRKTRPTTDKWRKNSFTAKSRKQVGNELEERTDSDVDDQNEQEDMVDDSIQKVKKKRKNISNKGKASNNARVKKEQNIEQSAECKTCHKVFSRVSSMLRHRRRSKCSQKENPPDDGTAYLKNLEKKLSLQTICTVCNRVLSSPANLKRHFDALHGDGIRGAENYNVVCAFEGCTKRFNLPSSMRKHYDAVHMNIRKYLCDICSDMFKNISALKMHMKACHTKDADMYECSVCKKRFSTKFKLTSHETLHTNIKPFSCDYEGCGKLFRLKDSLKKHLKTHQNYKPYVCTICNQAFSRKMYLETHQYKHTGIKMFKCTVCEKTFSQKGNLYVHMKCHGDQHVPFRCKVCHKMYTTEEGLRQHKLAAHNIHTVEPEELKDN